MNRLLCHIVLLFPLHLYAAIPTLSNNAVCVDTFSLGDTTVTPATCDFDASTGSNRSLYSIVMFENDFNVDITSITYNSVNESLVAADVQAGTSNEGVNIYQIASPAQPATGTNTFSLQLTASVNDAYVYNIVTSGSGGAGATASLKTTGTEASVSVTTTAADSRVYCAVASSDGFASFMAPTAGVTEVVDGGPNGINVFVGYIDAPTIGSYTCGASDDTSVQKVVVAWEDTEFSGNFPAIPDIVTSIDENLANGTNITSADFNDSNTGNDTDLDGNTITYSFTSTPAECHDALTINSTTGIPQVSDNTHLDWERVPAGCVYTVQADDGTGKTDTATLTINLNNLADESITNTYVHEGFETDDHIISKTPYASGFVWDNLPNNFFAASGNGEVYEPVTTQAAEGTRSVKLDFRGRNDFFNMCMQHGLGSQAPAGTQAANNYLIDGAGADLSRFFSGHTGTVTSTNTNQLINSSASFTSFVINPGQIVINTNTLAEATVVSVDNATTITLSADIFTVNGHGYDIRVPVTYVYNITDNRAQWTVASFQNSAATNDRANFVGNAPSLNGYLGGGAGDFDAGDQLDYYAQCNTMDVTNDNRRSDCDSCIQYFTGWTGGSIWPNDAVISRRFYIYMPSSNVNNPDNTFKLAYEATSNFAEGTIKLNMTDDPPTLQLNVNTPLNTTIAIQYDTWCYIEDYRKRESIEGNDGSLIVYLDCTGNQNPTPVHTAQGLNYGTLQTLSMFGNVQSFSDKDGVVYFDSLAIADSYIGPWRSFIREFGWKSKHRRDFIDQALALDHKTFDGWLIMYATPNDLVTRFDADELAQISVPRDMMQIDSTLLKLTIDAGDRSGYTPEEIAAADAALDKINRALIDATGEIDAHLESKYQLPLSSVSHKLKQVCSDIARFLIYDDHATDHISKRYDDAIHYLRQVNKGQIQLGIDQDQGVAEPDNNVVQFENGSNTFDRDNSKSFI